MQQKQHHGRYSTWHYLVPRQDGGGTTDQSLSTSCKWHHLKVWLHSFLWHRWNSETATSQGWWSSQHTDRTLEFWSQGHRTKRQLAVSPSPPMYQRYWRCRHQKIELEPQECLLCLHTLQMRLQEQRWCSGNTLSVHFGPSTLKLSVRSWANSNPKDNLHEGKWFIE